ncbi:MAG: hypothetical protein J5I59_13485 [Saprospiraceae bacterium]|nr:hypothetical protein [Saprospiraceae bacterium]
MKKYVFPFFISAILVVLLQFLNFNLNKGYNGNTVNKNRADLEFTEISSYIRHFNPNLLDSLDLQQIKIHQNTENFNQISIISGKVYDEKYRDSPGGSFAADNIHIRPEIIDKYLILSSKTKNSGYIHIRSLKSMAYPSFMTAMEKVAEKKGIDTLFIDLRHCREGVDDEAVKIANQFFLREDILMLEEYFFNNNKNEFNSTGKAFFPVNHLIVITDSTSGPIAILLAKILSGTDNAIISGNQNLNLPPIVRYFPLRNGDYVRIPIGAYRFYKYEGELKIPLTAELRVDQNTAIHLPDSLLHQ